jgi:hypothetical protein
MLAVSMLLLGNNLVDAATTTPAQQQKIDFGKADQKTPKDQLDVNEFEQYYYLQKRSKVSKTERGLYFDSSDINKDKMLSKAEAAAHE